MALVNIRDIVVENRISKNRYVAIAELASSIERLGLLHPIVLEANTNRLIAGERRLRACQFLEMTQIEATFREDLDEAKHLELEIEENIQREDLDWMEVVKGRERLHNLKTKIYGKPGDHGLRGGWRLEDTATSLGLNKSSLSQDLMLAKALAVPEVAKELEKIPGKKRALKVLRTVAEKQVIKEIAKREKKRIEEEGTGSIHTFNAKCIDVVKGLPDNSIDCGIVDPPFGIGDELLTHGADGKDCDFSNDPAESIALYIELVPELFRVLKPGTHCYLFFAVQYYQTIRDMCEAAGFEVRHMPLIWVKESGRMTAIDWKFMAKYEVFFFMAKPPSRPLNKPTPDAFVINREATTKRIHPMERPRALIHELLDISTFPGEMVLDPFSGSFVVPHVCKERGRQCIAVELNEDYYNRGLARLKGVVEGAVEGGEIEGEKEDKE